MGSSLTLEGYGLHSGNPSRVTLTRRDGPVVLEQGSQSAELETLRVVRSDCGVRVASPDGKLDVDLVEHLFAALAGLGICDGLTIRAHGSELPFLDAASGQWLEALELLDVPSRGPRLRVALAGEVRVGSSRYQFEPSWTTRIEVVADFEHFGLKSESASWNGRADSFKLDIAGARSFGFIDDYRDLLASGRAAGAHGSAILVFDREGRQLDSGPRRAEGELARHKLLDLLGDFYLGGGPILGTVRAQLPGHSRNLEAIASARSRGLLEPASG